jgi:RNA polymerase sigma-70 factor, ECF subfamily
VESTKAELLDFERIVRLYWKSVYRFIRASVSNVDAAHALTQDCFMRSYSKRESFRGEAGIKTWLMRIAVNLVRDYKRNRRLRFWERLRALSASPEDVSDRLPAIVVSPEEQAFLNEQVRIVWQAGRRLPDRQRTVFLFRFVEDMDLLEICAATGMKEGAVKAHLFRAIHAIVTQSDKIIQARAELPPFKS